MVPGEYMIADSLTKRMTADMIRNVMRHGKWSLTREGCQHLREEQMLFLGWG